MGYAERPSPGAAPPPISTMRTRTRLTHANSSVRKLATIALGLTVLVCLWFYFAPVALGGSTTYVVTDGISMEPRFHTGDLALVRSQSSYHVGEIVAYQSKSLPHGRAAPDHRPLTAPATCSRATTTTSWISNTPQASQLIGALWLHIPGAGATLESFRSPALIGGLVALGTLLFAGGVFTRRRRRRLDRCALPPGPRRSRWRLVRRAPWSRSAGALAIG